LVEKPKRCPEDDDDHLSDFTPFMRCKTNIVDDAGECEACGAYNDESCLQKNKQQAHEQPSQQLQATSCRDGFPLGKL